MNLHIEQKPLNGKLKDFGPISFVLVNDTKQDNIWDHMVRTWHYLGYDNMIGRRLKYLVTIENAVIAAISFNRASLRVEVRDAYIGWSDSSRKELLNHVVNNNRFLILPWIKIKNLASHILAKAIRKLDIDWYRLYGVKLYAVETFVDKRYSGTCYKAANWQFLGETRGFSKQGKSFYYHGNTKGVFVYTINKELINFPSRSPRKRPNPKFSHVVRDWTMMLSKPDWSPDLFEQIGLNEQTVADLGLRINDYLKVFKPCFERINQYQNCSMYVKGLLSNLERKSIEPIALNYADEKAVRTLQMFMKDSPWNDQLMKQIYQSRVATLMTDPNGMITFDDTGLAKKGKNSAGVKRQYCGRLGKVENCQVGVFAGYSGKNGNALLDSKLYLPDDWFDEDHKKLWSNCDIPEDTTFHTKIQLASEMLNEFVNNHSLVAKWVGCDAAFGCSTEFRKSIPANMLFFGDIHSNQMVFRKRPEWLLPEYKQRGKKPVKLQPSVLAAPVSSIVEDSSLPWHEVLLMEGSKGPVYAQVKCCRVTECIDNKDGDELWCYIRKYEDGKIKYALSNAEKDIELSELHHAAILRWPIEQSFQECKSFLGLADYETRSYTAWHRHMLLVMVAQLFVLEIRHIFKKKPNVAMTQ